LFTEFNFANMWQIREKQIFFGVVHAAIWKQTAIWKRWSVYCFTIK